MTEKELIQKQIEELQSKLEELEKQEPQITLVNSGNCDMVSYNDKYYYLISFHTGSYFWIVRSIGSFNFHKVDDPGIIDQLENFMTKIKGNWK